MPGALNNKRKWSLYESKSQDCTFNGPKQLKIGNYAKKMVGAYKAKSKHKAKFQDQMPQLCKVSINVPSQENK